MNFRLFAAAAALAVFAACGGGAGGYGTTAFSGPVLSDMLPAQAATLGTATFTTASRGMQTGLALSDGFAVYAFGLDPATPGASACTATCTSAWPPLAVPAGATPASPFGALRRSDGSLQLTYNGHPLYTSVRDTSAGMAQGDALEAFGNSWYLAQPASLTPFG